MFTTHMLCSQKSKIVVSDWFLKLPLGNPRAITDTLMSKDSIDHILIKQVWPYHDIDYSRQFHNILRSSKADDVISRCITQNLRVQSRLIEFIKS